MRVALVHDWLTGMRGGEKVLARLAELTGARDIYTLLHVPGSCPSLTRNRRVHTSFLDDLPAIGRVYRHLLPAMPLAIERMDLSGYDLVVSSSHCVSKGFGGRGPSQRHICYCHTPMRYVWAVGEDYRRRMGRISGTALSLIRPWLRQWDRRTARHVDLYLANSATVARRIHDAYDMPAEVLHPPIDTEYYRPGGKPREDFYLVVSAFAPYKRIDQAVEAFRQLGKRLVIAGSGQMLPAIRADCPDNIELLGWQPDEKVRELMQRCRALIFPGLEDFGMVPVEAMACGAPVIAYNRGGATETVRDVLSGIENPTGLLYEPQTVEALIDAVRRFEKHRSDFDPHRMHQWAETFSPRRFDARFRKLAAPVLDGCC
ncbi:MAG: glycosyltransferase [Phycisphaerae bacterium]